MEQASLTATDISNHLKIEVGKGPSIQRWASIGPSTEVYCLRYESVRSVPYCNLTLMSLAVVLVPWQCCVALGVDRMKQWEAQAPFMYMTSRSNLETDLLYGGQTSSSVSASMD